MFQMESNYGSPIVVSDDSDVYEGKVDVCLAVNGTDVLLTPRKARQLAKALKRQAKQAEAARFIAMTEGHL